MNANHTSDRATSPGLVEDDNDIETLSYLVTRFAAKEIAPHVTEWDQAGEFPRALYARAAQLGLLGLGYPEDLGGTPASQRMRSISEKAYSVSARTASVA